MPRMLQNLAQTVSHRPRDDTIGDLLMTAVPWYWLHSSCNCTLDEGTYLAYTCGVGKHLRELIVSVEEVSKGVSWKGFA